MHGSQRSRRLQGRRPRILPGKVVGLGRGITCILFDKKFLYIETCFIDLSFHICTGRYQVDELLNIPLGANGESSVLDDILESVPSDEKLG